MAGGFFAKYLLQESIRLVLCRTMKTTRPAKTDHTSAFLNVNPKHVPFAVRVKRNKAKLRNALTATNRTKAEQKQVDKFFAFIEGVAKKTAKK